MLVLHFATFMSEWSAAQQTVDDAKATYSSQCVGQRKMSYDLQSFCLNQAVKGEVYPILVALQRTLTTCVNDKCTLYNREVGDGVLLLIQNVFFYSLLFWVGVIALNILFNCFSWKTQFSMPRKASYVIAAYDEPPSRPHIVYQQSPQIMYHDKFD